MTREDISQVNPDALACDGFDDAIIGYGERINLGPIIAYNVEKMINILMDRDNMSYEDAVEYFEFNIRGSWVGEFTPIFITTSLD